MSRGERVAAAALGAVGARFRLHGRDVAGGLDCVGLVALALRAGGCVGEVPGGYALRGGSVGAVRAAAAALGLCAVADAAAGDVVLVCAGAGQLHLAVRVVGGIVHADAMLRRVVLRPGALPWPPIGQWRLPEQE